MLKLSLKQCIGLILLLSLIILPFWRNASNNIYEPVEINDSTIGFYQSTTCNMSLINVVKKNLQNDLDLTSCRRTCRMDEANKYLFDLIEDNIPHKNFI